MPPRRKTELLHGPLLKLDRAKHHIDDLRGKIDTFLAGKPFRLIIQIRSNPGKLALRVKQDRAIPDSFSLVIGDAVHNLRSALDLTMYGMAHDRASKPNRIQFPFPKSNSAKDIKDAFDSAQVKGAGTKVIETILSFRPFPKNGNATLCNLHALSNRDKHRLLILSRSIPRMMPGTPAGNFISHCYGANVPLTVPVLLAGDQDGDLFTADWVGENDMEGDASFQPNFSISFGLGEPFANRPVIETLQKCHEQVTKAVDLLADAYLSPENAFL
jgi:hypothetical protein